MPTHSYTGQNKEDIFPAHHYDIYYGIYIVGSLSG